MMCLVADPGAADQLRGHYTWRSDMPRFATRPRAGLTTAPAHDHPLGGGLRTWREGTAAAGGDAVRSGPPALLTEGGGTRRSLLADH